MNSEQSSFQTTAEYQQEELGRVQTAQALEPGGGGGWRGRWWGEPAAEVESKTQKAQQYLAWGVLFGPLVSLGNVNIENKPCLGPWPVSSWKVEINPALRCWDVTNLAWGRPLSFLSLTILTLSSPRKQKWPKQPSAFHLWMHFFPFWFTQQSG